MSADSENFNIQNRIRNIISKVFSNIVPDEADFVFINQLYVFLSLGDGDSKTDKIRDIFSPDTLNHIEEQYLKFISNQKPEVIARMGALIATSLGDSHVVFEKALGDPFVLFKRIVSEIRNGKSFVELLPIYLQIPDTEEDILRELDSIFPKEQTEKEIKSILERLLRFNIAERLNAISSTSFQDLVYQIHTTLAQNQVNWNHQPEMRQVRRVVGP